MNPSNRIQLAVLCVTSLGILSALYTNHRQMRLLEKQMKASFFADYPRRFHGIMQNFPPDIGRESFDFNSLSEVGEKVLKNMRLYIDLCSEEYELWQSGMQEERVWNWGIRY